MTTDAKAIRAERFTEIGVIIQRDVRLLIDRWSQRAVQEQPRAQRVHQQVLLDHLPTFLAEMGRSLMETTDPYHLPHYQAAAQHGEQRWEVGWSLQEVCRDYQILRLVILDYLDEVVPRPLRMGELLAVGLVLDDAIEASVTRFTQFCEEQFTRQADALRLADRRKKEFLATLAHELRNPLAPLRTSIEVLRLNRTDPTVIDHAREIMERQVRQMTHLVDDLLDMSSIALGKLQLRKERLDLRNVLTQAVQMSAPLAQARRQVVQSDLPANPLWVEGDHARLLQIFVNLLNNAVKYTPNEGRIKVAATRQDGIGLVRVQDNGIGIPPEMLSEIFDLFTQIDLGMERVQGGLGIGLSLVRQLVDLHGGSISAKSAGTNQGSEFTVMLPLVDLHQPGMQVVEVPAPITTRRRILLVEDNPDARESLALLLKLIGQEVLVAETGEQAIAVARQQSVDVVFLDLGLPDLDGCEVARQLRAELGPGPLLVALTGYSQPEDRQRSLDAGCQTHLSKPVELHTLLTLLESKVIES